MSNITAYINDRVNRALGMGLARAMAIGLAESRRRLMGGGGPKTRSGRLLGSLSVGVKREDDALVGTLKSNASYAAIHEYGGVIQAQRHKCLKFRVQGRWVQKRKVIIPARPFLRPGLEAAKNALDREVARALREEFS